jgi:hypothetical protein
LLLFDDRIRAIVRSDEMYLLPGVRILRSLALKEMTHQEVVGNMKKEMARLKRDLEESAGLARDQVSLTSSLSAYQRTSDSKLILSLDLQTSNIFTELQQVRSQGETDLRLAEKRHQAELIALRQDHEQALGERISKHDEVVSSLSLGHRDALYKETQASASMIEAQKVCPSSIDPSRGSKLTLPRSLIQVVTASIQDETSNVKTQLADAHLARKEAESAFSAELEHLQAELAEAQNSLSSVDEQKTALESDVTTLRQQLVDDNTSADTALSEVSTHRDSLLQELEAFQSELSQSRTLVDSLRGERAAQDEKLRDLEMKLSGATLLASSVPKRASPEPHTHSINSDSRRESLRDVGRAGSPATSRPAFPPPSTPVPPVPSSTFSGLPASQDDSSASHAGLRDSSLSSSRFSVSTATSLAESTSTDRAQVHEVEEAMKTLHKRLLHCEADLQANLDLYVLALLFFLQEMTDSVLAFLIDSVSTLESALVRPSLSTFRLQTC